MNSGSANKDFGVAASGFLKTKIWYYNYRWDDTDRLKDFSSIRRKRN